MNTKLATTTLLVLSSLVAGTSFAGGSAMPQAGDYDVLPVASSISTLTREAVKAEYQAAKLAGVLPQAGDVDVAYAKTAPSTLTREAVNAEYLAARKAGTLPRNGEFN